MKSLNATKHLAILIIIFLMLSLTACGDKEDENANPFLGEWELNTVYYGKETKNLQEMNDLLGVEFTFLFNFKEDGTVATQMLKDVQEYEYSFEGQTAIIHASTEIEMTIKGDELIWDANDRLAGATLHFIKKID